MSAGNYKMIKNYKHIIFECFNTINSPTDIFRETSQPSGVRWISEGTQLEQPENTTCLTCIRDPIQ